MNAVLLVSPLIFFIIFSKESDVKKCYYCKKDCENLDYLKEEPCDAEDNTTNYLCQASSFKIRFMDQRKLHTTRKCVPDTEKIKDDCEKMNEEEDSSCYTCDTDLCNKYIQEEEDMKNETQLDLLIESNVTKCYKCMNDCDDPEEEICYIPYTSSYLCQAKTYQEKNKTVEVRSCVAKTEQTETFCRLLNTKKEKGHACYTCEADLCNDKNAYAEKNKPVEVPVEGGVKKCFFCEEGPCENSKEISCDTITSDFLCKASVVEKDGVVKHLRECVTNTREEKYACEVDDSKDGGSCYTCNKNLCNKKAKQNPLDFLVADELSVEKCYFCKGECEEPRVEKCDIKSYLCQEMKILNKDGIAYEGERKCVQNTEAAVEACKRLNKTPGISCYTCDTDLCNNKYIIAEHFSSERPTSSGNHPAPEMLLATLLSPFLTKLLRSK